MARVTRSSTRTKTAIKKPEEEEPAAAKPAKKAAAKKAPKPAKAAAPKKKADKKAEKEAEPEKKEASPGKADEGETVVSVEAKAVVEINKEKPGRGNFVVRVSGVEAPIVELLGLKRPFPPLKALDMDEICAKVVEAIS
ncbi:MAG: hypothetical protein SGBAC_013186 [Bacillariaceae sp.]